MPRPHLLALELAADPEAWAAAGFAVDGDGRCRVGTVDLVLRGAPADGGPGGIVSWTLAGAIPADDGIDGLRTIAGQRADRGAVSAPVAHPNGATGVDHVVVATPDLARTLEAFDAAGLEVRRVRDAGTPDRPLRQAFLLLAEALVEVVGPPEPGADEPASARFWGVTLVVEDLNATAEAPGDALGPVRGAVQPGRRIATFRREARLGVPVALMTPRS